MVKVSVIVPIYNAEKYLEQCLDSIVNQTLKDIEIICIDDGSTDSSHDILKEYADNVILINKSVLKSGNAEEVFSSPEFKESFFYGLD